MINSKVKEVAQHEGVVTIVSWGKGEEPNARATWNSYLRFKDEDKILVPIAGFSSIQADVAVNDKVKVVFGAREVEGFNDYQGTGFLLEGRAEFTDSGADFEMMKEEYSFINKIMTITVETSQQLI